jgi:hypothetical protein
VPPNGLQAPGGTQNQANFDALFDKTYTNA